MTDCIVCQDRRRDDSGGSTASSTSDSTTITSSSSASSLVRRPTLATGSLSLAGVVTGFVPGGLARSARSRPRSRLLCAGVGAGPASAAGRRGLCQSAAGPAGSASWGAPPCLEPPARSRPLRPRAAHYLCFIHTRRPSPARRKRTRAGPRPPAALQTTSTTTASPHRPGHRTTPPALTSLCCGRLHLSCLTRLASWTVSCKRRCRLPETGLHSLALHIFASSCRQQYLLACPGCRHHRRHHPDLQQQQQHYQHRHQYHHHHHRQPCTDAPTACTLLHPPASPSLAHRTHLTHLLSLHARATAPSPNASRSPTGASPRLLRPPHLQARLHHAAPISQNHSRPRPRPAASSVQGPSHAA